MGLYTESAEGITAPVQGNVAVVDTTTTTIFFDLWATVGAVANYWANRFVTIAAVGADVVFALNTDGTTALNTTNRSTPSTGQPATAAGRTLAAGRETTFIVPPKSSGLRYLAVRTVSGTGTIEITPTSDKISP